MGILRSSLDLRRHCQEHFGVGSAGGDTVNGDVLAACFLGEGGGEANERCLCGCVVDLTGVALDGGGADINDTTVLIVAHLLINAVSPVEYTVEVGVDDLQPLLGGHLMEDSVTGDSSVVDQNIDAAETLHDLRNSSFYLLGIGNVAFDGESGRTQFLGGLAGSGIAVSGL